MTIRMTSIHLAAFAGALVLVGCGANPEPEAQDDSAATAIAADEAGADDGNGAMDGAPAGSASSGAAASAANQPVRTASGDPIRGPGGLEEKCLARVGNETGAPVIGTNRIEESEAAIEIYVNVEGASAPWKCLGNRDGSIEEVTFTGSEGDL